MPSTRFARTLRILMGFFCYYSLYTTNTHRHICAHRTHSKSINTHTHSHTRTCTLLFSPHFYVLKFNFVFFLFSIWVFWWATIIICPLWFSRARFSVHSHFVIDMKSVYAVFPLCMICVNLNYVHLIDLFNLCLCFIAIFIPYRTQKNFLLWIFDVVRVILFFFEKKCC